ncbi:MAG TPA: M14 family metallopeptidase [Bacillales bacterium]
MASRKIFSLALTIVCMSTLVFTAGWTSPQAGTSLPEIKDGNKSALVRIELPDRDKLDDLVARGLDLTEHVGKYNGVLTVDAIVTPAQLQSLRDEGLKVETITTAKEVERILTQRQQKVEEIHQVTAEKDQVNILRANFFTNQSGSFLYVEAKTSAGLAKSVVLTAYWKDAAGNKHSAAMERKVDQNEYLYHHLLLPVGTQPSEVTVKSNQGGSAVAPVTEWIGDDKPRRDNKHYVTDFIDHYMTPEETTKRIEELAAEFPELAEVVALPYKTHGYRRKAQAIIGDARENPASAVVLTSKKWGHKGGNQLSVEVNVPEQANSDLYVVVTGNKITVNLATDNSGEPTSSAAEVIQALNAGAGDMITATTFRGNDGQGTVQPQAEIQLDNHLSAPDSVPREPFTVKAIRIGKHRDGSKLGVLAYAQEHAREWVTPLVAVETAERLLRNYAQDAETRKLVNNLDIFIIPSVNPDGANYSMFDYNWQRKNMTNHCSPKYSDPLLRNNWGVDVNRNYSVGSVRDGYIGASTFCLSGVYAGPGELSEPEAKNIAWIADQHPNIQFAMNIHSYGGYFMWPPGAYNAERETLPRPTAGEEAYFWQASKTILKAIKQYRGTVILPGKTGPVPDVLYSAAGNSADELWYNYGIYAWDFEVGADLWNAEKNRWEGVGFQPPYEEGHAEAMEFANGLIGMLKVAYQYEKDHQPPHTSLVPGKGTYQDEVAIHFQTSEPATIYYTLDGSRPTFESKTIQPAGPREGAESLTLDETTTIKWFSMDGAGNIEKHYKPAGHAKNFNKAKLIIK